MFNYVIIFFLSSSSLPSLELPILPMFKWMGLTDGKLPNCLKLGLAHRFIKINLMKYSVLKES